MKSILLWISLLPCLGAYLFADDFLDSFMGDEEYSEDEEAMDEDSVRYQLDNAFDLLEKNRSLKLQAEQFIYPFNVQHDPMLTANLVPSVTQNSGGFRNTTVQQKNDPAKASGGKIQSLSVNNDGPASLAGIVAKQDDLRKRDEKDRPKKSVELPPFDISGKFGTDQDQFIVIGNRYYSIDERLKGSREMRQIKLIGIDEHMAYFSYQDTTFARKIKALERIF